VARGTARVTIGEEQHTLGRGETMFVARNMHHRIENISSVEPLEIIEIQTGDYLGETTLFEWKTTSVGLSRAPLEFSLHMPIVWKLRTNLRFRPLAVEKTEWVSSRVEEYSNTLLSLIAGESSSGRNGEFSCCFQVVDRNVEM
jgi:hypothetical protein